MEDWTYEDFKTNFEDAMIEYDDCVTFGKPEEERKEALCIYIVAMQDLCDNVDKLKDSMEQYETYLANLKATFARLQSLHRGEEKPV